MGSEKRLLMIPHIYCGFSLSQGFILGRSEMIQRPANLLHRSICWYNLLGIERRAKRGIPIRQEKICQPFHIFLLSVTVLEVRAY